MLSERREMCHTADIFARLKKRTVIFFAYFFGVIKKVSTFATCFVPLRHKSDDKNEV